MRSAAGSGRHWLFWTPRAASSPKRNGSGGWPGPTATAVARRHAKSSGCRGGRGGRGGQDGGNSSNAVDASLDINGQIWIDLATHQVSDLRIKDKVAVAQTTNMTFGRDGEEMDIESNNDTKGKFEVKLHCKPAETK